jgi:hypothetical protein
MCLELPWLRLSVATKSDLASLTLIDKLLDCGRPNVQGDGA